jgi:hypothetical protein
VCAGAGWLGGELYAYAIDVVVFDLYSDINFLANHVHLFEKRI